MRGRVPSRSSARESVYDEARDREMQRVLTERITHLSEKVRSVCILPLGSFMAAFTLIIHSNIHSLLVFLQIDQLQDENASLQKRLYAAEADQMDAERALREQRHTSEQIQRDLTQRLAAVQQSLDELQDHQQMHQQRYRELLSPGRAASLSPNASIMIDNTVHDLRQRLQQEQETTRTLRQEVREK